MQILESDSLTHLLQLRLPRKRRLGSSEGLLVTTSQVACWPWYSLHHLPLVVERAEWVMPMCLIPGIGLRVQQKPALLISFGPTKLELVSCGNPAINKDGFTCPLFKKNHIYNVRTSREQQGMLFNPLCKPTSDPSLFKYLEHLTDNHTIAHKYSFQDAVADFNIPPARSIWTLLAGSGISSFQRN